MSLKRQCTLDSFGLALCFIGGSKSDYSRKRRSLKLVLSGSRPLSQMSRQAGEVVAVWLSVDGHQVIGIRERTSETVHSVGRLKSAAG